MPRLLLFNPENDLALANGGKRYTAPPQAQLLRRDGRMLPLAYADEGDGLFGEADPQGLDPLPWGWSAAVRGEFSRAGVPDNKLPDYEAIERLRQLSHRRTAARLVELTGIGRPMVEADSIEVVERMLGSGEPLMLKSPWSSSGRGLIDSSIVGHAEVLRQAAGVINRQGSVMVEPLYTRLADFALLFDITPQGPQARGLSVFTTNSHRAYTGNVLAPESALHAMIATAVPDIDALRAKVVDALDRLLTGRYTGPVGVDMMATTEGPAVCEVNLRMTMGRVAAEYYRRRIADGRCGSLSVVATKDFAPGPDSEVLSQGPSFTLAASLEPTGTA